MGRHFKFKQTNVLKAVESLGTLSIRDASKRFGVSKQAIEYALKKKQQTHNELEKIQSLTPDKKTKFEIEQLTRLIYLSFELLQEKLSKARAKDLAIIGSILIDKRNLLLTRSTGSKDIDFPEMSKKTKILIEQFLYKNKSPKDINPKDIIDSEPTLRIKSNLTKDKP